MKHIIVLTSCFYLSHFAACDLVLHCLSMSHKKDGRLKWVKVFFVLFFYPSLEVIKNMLNSCEHETAYDK